MKLHNFCAGPSILPQTVIDQSAKAIIELDDIGLSLLEISHRSNEFVGIIEEAIDLVKSLLNVPEGYEVLFLQGGASMQFAMVPMNLLSVNGTAGIVGTGVWTSKAIKDGGCIGKFVEVASSEDKGFTYIPKGFTVDSHLDYLHIATNNTIYGTEWHQIPSFDLPLVADMSSNIFSRPIDVSKFGLIFAGAQKNLGAAGATLVIVKKDLLGKTGRKIPNMLDYTAHIKGQSLYNTPPVFAIYTCLLTLRWLKNLGGLAEMENRNQAKSELLYKEIDRNSLIYGVTEKEDRSRMNVTFRLHDEAMNESLSAFFAQRGIVNIEGHRSVGGFRASLYNALSIESVEVLVEALQSFEQSHQ
ncbi:MAG: 3-phosphoserine/phosphohydroxythreonine transaminase [Chitinophagales bacterium]